MHKGPVDIYGVELKFRTDSKHKMMYNLEPSDKYWNTEKANDILLRMWTSNKLVYFWIIGRYWNSLPSLLSLTAFPAPLTLELLLHRGCYSITSAPNFKTRNHASHSWAVVGIWDGHWRSYLFHITCVNVKKLKCFYSSIHWTYITWNCQEKRYKDELWMVTLK